MIFPDCQKCFHSACLKAYRCIPAYTKSSTKSKFMKSHHRLSGGGTTGSNEQDMIIRTPDINSIENCSFYSTENNYVCLNKYSVSFSSHLLFNFVIHFAYDFHSFSYLFL